VFVERGSGRLEPRKIVTGRSAGDDIEIVEGLQAGERVAASGNFLLDSEAKLRSALPKWKNPDTQPVTKESTK
jgi:Cu(I)/Ag(I) efflux system membrane fusion protein